MTAAETPPGWISISDLARQRGVDKSAVSRRVSRLAGLGLLSPRVMGKAKLVNLAEFDRAAAATVDAVREANGRGPTGSLDAGAPGGPILSHEQARRARTESLT